MAGFSAGRGACARGGCSARRCFALARRNDIPLYRIVNCAAARRLCLPDIVPAQGYRARGAVRRGDVVLSVCFAFGSCRACVPLGMSRVRFVPGVRSYRNVLRSITPAVCRIAPNRTACDILRFYSAGSRSPFVRSRSALRLSALAGSLRACAFFYGDPDRERKERRDAENGVGGAAFVRFCVGALALICFPRGVRWGCAPQTCAKESSTLWTLFTLRRGWVGADSPRLYVFAQSHWPCESFRREYAGAKSGSRTAAAPDCAKEPLALWTLFIWVVMWVRFTRRSRVRFTRALPVITGR